jgi:hypothetical protein
VWGLRATEAEVTDWRLCVGDPQETVYPARRCSFERCIAETDNGPTSAKGHSRGINPNQEEGRKKDERVEQHA